MKLSSKLVQKLASDYDSTELSDLEIRLFQEVSPTVRERGHLVRDEFFDICYWKSERPKYLVRTNSDSDIQEISKIAFAVSERFRSGILSLLHGVLVPTASAILTVWNQDAHTVYDRRVRDALLTLEHPRLDPASIKAARSSYHEYLLLVRTISTDLKVSLRELDKAFWIWDKISKQYTTTPIN
jgi:hypothetical protein